nr:MAG TPA: hypothetical protein [Caudoviricetes sp.]
MYGSGGRGAWALCLVPVVSWWPAPQVDSY